MAFTPQTLQWPDRRAIVLIHGVGSYTKASYSTLIDTLKTAVGATEWDRIAVYTTLYDVFNDWTAEKTRSAALISELVKRLKFHFDSDALGETAAGTAGDVIWPVLSLDARHALRDAIMAQLQRTVRDGDLAGVRRANQKITLLCHSLGCFHAYEALTAMVDQPVFRLQPVEDAVQFDNVILFASPVKLIRSVAGWLGRLVPEPDDLGCLKGAGLALPGATNMANRFVPSTRRFVSVTGDLDPVGGFVFRKRLDWAYMDIPGQESHVDDQQIVNVATRQDLAQVLEDAMDGATGLSFTPNNPHDWVGYVTRNEGLVKECLLS